MWIYLTITNHVEQSWLNFNRRKTTTYGNHNIPISFQIITERKTNNDWLAKKIHFYYVIPYTVKVVYQTTSRIFQFLWQKKIYNANSNRISWCNANELIGNKSIMRSVCSDKFYTQIPYQFPASKWFLLWFRLIYAQQQELLQCTDFDLLLACEAAAWSCLFSILFWYL